MMNLKEVREAYEELSGLLSSVVRQINFAGIAIIWIFVDKDKNIVPQLLLKSSLFVVVSICFDALQYFISTLVWHITYVYKHEPDGRKDEEITVRDSEWKSVISWILLYLKFIATLIAYIFILRFFIVQFKL